MAKLETLQRGGGHRASSVLAPLALAVRATIIAQSKLFMWGYNRMHNYRLRYAAG